MMLSVKTLIAASAIAVAMAAGWSHQSHAIPVTHILTLTETFPGTAPAPFVGTFVIDDSFLNPNTFIPFDDFISFDITTYFLAFSLADAKLPSIEGVVTDGFGMVLRFEDTGAGIVAEFQVGNDAIDLSESAFEWTYFSSGIICSPGVSTICGGDYTIEKEGLAAIPEPASGLLFAAGLLVVMWLPWRAPSSG